MATTFVLPDTCTLIHPAPGEQLECRIGCGEEAAASFYKHACNNVFCATCLEDWVWHSSRQVGGMRRTLCPMCRARLYSRHQGLASEEGGRPTSSSSMSSTSSNSISIGSPEWRKWHLQRWQLELGWQLEHRQRILLDKRSSPRPWSTRPARTLEKPTALVENRTKLNLLGAQVGFCTDEILLSSIAAQSGKSFPYTSFQFISRPSHTT